MQQDLRFFCGLALFPPFFRWASWLNEAQSRAGHDKKTPCTKKANGSAIGPRSDHVPIGKRSGIDVSHGGTGR
ncbi:hypothetical protein SODALDRAFT_334308 [Sodiomyces alkalinus F11]|uniref:Uncharacterized protein n=1 Tax=Sodiomyces alkalinus (strain CBS 110278 / VKM F-3762 / F11) TaxID=1314773 RepID=A0A3N2PS20_SODAK|nr:hypothetical protein SODALDRAFT_334308 [Sodiomyces alkalinus F11]ROT37224.1 hypothetical protein SODALDRAFT_334308 [Sodiomyces alkalinus F11]